MMADKTLQERVASLETEVKYLKYIVGASVAANIGVQFVGCPIHTIIMTYLAFFCGVFLIVSTIARWKYLPVTRRIEGLLFSVFVLFSSICRTFIFHPGETLSPFWYSPTLDGILITLLLVLILFSWYRKA